LENQDKIIEVWGIYVPSIFATSKTVCLFCRSRNQPEEEEEENNDVV
jgi:hypothetical protein